VAAGSLLPNYLGEFVAADDVEFDACVVHVTVTTDAPSARASSF
jgi:hypothetical protein